MNHLHGTGTNGSHGRFIAGSPGSLSEAVMRRYEFWTLKEYSLAPRLLAKFSRSWSPICSKSCHSSSKLSTSHITSHFLITRCPPTSISPFTLISITLKVQVTKRPVSRRITNFWTDYRYLSSMKINANSVILVELYKQLRAAKRDNEQRTAALNRLKEKTIANHQTLSDLNFSAQVLSINAPIRMQINSYYELYLKEVI